MANPRVIDSDINLPTPRKYEAGTALDYNRQYRDTGKYGEILELTKRPSIKQLQDMFMNDAQAQQLFSAVRTVLKGVSWEILAGKQDKGERDFVGWALGAREREGGMTTPMDTIFAQMSNAVGYRLVGFEKVWKVSEVDPYKGYHILHKLGYRPPATISIKTDANGSYNGFVQRAFKGDKYIEMPFSAQRSLAYIHGYDYAGITGYTPFDVVYKNYLNKVKVSFFYFAFLENVAFPRTLVKVAGDDPEELQYLLDKARLFSSQGIMGLYDTEEIESYESQRNTRDYQSALEYLNWEMARAVFGQFLDLGTSGERGSYALSKDKISFFYNSVESILKEITEIVNNYIIADLVQYNFGRNAAYPVIRFKPLNDESAQDVLETYRQVIMANTPNVTPDFLLKLMKRVEEILGLEIDPLAEYSDMEFLQILQSIPTAREHLLSREARAGSGQNPITGEDRNANNLTPQNEEPGRGQQAQAGMSPQELLNDQLDIVNQMRAPESDPRTKFRNRRRRR